MCEREIKKFFGISTEIGTGIIKKDNISTFFEIVGVRVLGVAKKRWHTDRNFNICTYICMYIYGKGIT